MGLRLLGPVEVMAGDRPLDPGGRRQRIVLAVLGLNANRVVAVDHLIDAIWSDDPPVTARSQIQICISALRKLLADAGHPRAIDTKAPGYVLNMAAADIDALRFSELAATARRLADADQFEEAAGFLHEALGLWRGDALSGVDSEMLRRSATVLAERRVAAVEERVRLDLALGRHLEIIDELQALVADNPLRERLHALLMLALYRAGRQAEALEASRRARVVLAEEVGLDPGREIQELEQSILHGDPKLGPPDPPSAAALPSTYASVSEATALAVAVPRHLPASVLDFTGRGAELAAIRDVLNVDEARRTWGMPIVNISGKGGVGKSSLATRAAHELSQDYPDGQLYADMGSWDGDEHTGKLLARFLRALGIAGSAVPEDIEERSELFRSRLSGKRLLLVLDDVPPDASILPLLPGSPSCAVIITSRVQPGRLPGAYHVVLDVFDRTAAREMLVQMIGPERVAAESVLADELVDLCDRLPLALRITGARLASRPHWRIEDLVDRMRDEARRLDEFSHHGLELRSSIGLTYRGLSPPAQRLFRRFALVRGRNFPGWTAAALLDTDAATADDLLDRLVGAHLVDVVQYSGATPRYKLHDLIRVFAAEKLQEAESGPQRRAALARVVGGWLALADLAHRKEYGGDYTTLHGRAPRWQRVLEQIGDGLPEPTIWWESERHALVAAVRLTADEGLDELCWDLALATVTLFEAKGYFDDWRECARAALDVTSRAGNRIGAAAMHYSLGSLCMIQMRLDEATTHFVTSLEAFRGEGHDHGCALVLRNFAHIDGLRDDTDGMIDKYIESLTLMRRVGDRIGEAHVMRGLANARLGRGDTEAAFRLLREALAICRETGCRRVEAQVLSRLAEAHLAVDELDQAGRALREVLAIVHDTDDRIGEVHALFGLGRLHVGAKDAEQAEDTFRQSLALARRLGERLIEAQSRYALGEIALAAGRGSQAVGDLEAARDLFDKLGSTTWHARAVELLERARA